MKEMVNGLCMALLWLVVGVWSACPTSPPASGKYITKVRLFDKSMNSVQAWLTEGDQTVESCVEMKTNSRAKIFELECCDVCVLTSEWLTGFENQYVSEMEVVTVINQDGTETQSLSFKYEQDGIKAPFVQELDDNHYVNPELFFYFSTPFDIPEMRDETENIFVFTAGRNSDSLDYLLNLHYDQGIGGPVTETAGYTSLDSGSFDSTVFRDWDLEATERNLGCFDEPTIGFSIPVSKEDTDSCFGNATVQFTVDSSTGAMTSMTLLDYDMFIAGPSTDHNARGVSFDKYGTEVRVYFPNDDYIRYIYDEASVIDGGARCDRNRVPMEDQC